MLAADQSLRQLANLQTVFSEGLAAARRLFAALDVEPEIRDAPDRAADPPTARDGAVRGRRLRLWRRRAGLDRRCRWRPGAARPSPWSAPPAAARARMLNLIPRFYDVTGGRVTIDGHDIREVTLASLRDQIALVTQEPFLFDDTIRANIAYAKPGATEAEIEAAARAGRRPRLHRRPAQGLRHPGRRGRRAAFRRPAPAHRHRPRLPEGRADPAARRGDQRARHRERGPGAGGAGAADGRPHHHR